MHQENLDELKKIHKENSKLNHISQEEKNKMGELYSKGYTIGQIAKEFNRGTTSVHDNLHKLENWEEIKAAHDKVIEENFISEETLSKIEKDFRQGKSYSELFHTFNLAAGTIAERLQKKEN